MEEKGEGMEEKGEGMEEKGEGMEEKGEGMEEKGEGRGGKGSLQCSSWPSFKMEFFVKILSAFESYGVKQSEEANMQISTGLPRLALRTLEAPEVATQGEYRLPPAI